MDRLRFKNAERDGDKTMTETSKSEELNIVDPVLAAVVDQYFSQRFKKSFSERNPELGRMIKCATCGLRHRKALVCVPMYAKYTEQSPRPLINKGLVNGPHRIVCRSRKPQGRILKHRNARSLQVLERAAKYYNEDLVFFSKDISQEDRDALGKSCLSRSLNEIRAERKENSRRHRVIAKRSRRINRGLL